MLNHSQPCFEITIKTLKNKFSCQDKIFKAIKCLNKFFHVIKQRVKLYEKNLSFFMKIYEIALNKLNKLLQTILTRYLPSNIISQIR